ncbi:hypothetical protein EK21DRAFT_76189 [Setomelanomma holmii]|uniref:BTB domain-containing protein n=1 Tax=Setomelanomma holmii TaxID=210430 RepID=A0A9P4LGE2_9PLEO|nr:hypothetical protein EK21DRAFT_76189 [Setomelanomma holmii]
MHPDLSDFEADEAERDNSMAPHNLRVPLTEAFDLCGKIINLKAGQGNDAVTIQIHQDVLSRNSEFFKRIVKPEWAELREDPDTIDMGPEHSAEEVKCYAHWLYSGMISTRDFDNVNGTKSDPIWVDLANAYVFAEKMMDQRYKCAILETIAGVQRDAPDYPCAEAFNIVYDGTPEGSPARRLLVDMYAYGAYDAPDWNEELEKLPHEALADVLRATIKVRRENLAR